MSPYYQVSHFRGAVQKRPLFSKPDWQFTMIKKNSIVLTVLFAALIAAITFWGQGQKPTDGPQAELTRFEDGSLGVTFMLDGEIGRPEQPRKWTLRLPAEFQPAIDYSVLGLSFGQSSSGIAKDSQFLNVVLSLPDLNPVKIDRTPKETRHHKDNDGRVDVLLSNNKSLTNYLLSRKLETGVCKLGETNSVGLHELLHGVPPKDAPQDACTWLVDKQHKVSVLKTNEQLIAIVTTKKNFEEWRTELGGWTLTWEWQPTDTMKGRDVNQKVLEL